MRPKEQCHHDSAALTKGGKRRRWLQTRINTWEEKRTNFKVENTPNDNTHRDRIENKVLQGRSPNKTSQNKLRKLLAAAED